MTTSAEFEPELVEALNLLIEDERASVEMEVALASGATEYAERDALSRMGIEDIATCETLRAEMEGAGLPVTPQINGVVFEVLGAERYDDRLRAFAHHQRIVSERASDLLESNLDGALRDALEVIVASHERHGAWATDRADEFAATRLLEFGARQETASSAAPQVAAPAEPGAEPPIDLTLPVEAAIFGGEDVASSEPASEAILAPLDEASAAVEMAAAEEGAPEEAPGALPVRRSAKSPRATAVRKPAATKKPAAKPRARKTEGAASITTKSTTRRKPAPPAGE